MSDRRLHRERAKVVYAEYDDEDYDSPDKKPTKKRVIDSEDEEPQQKPRKAGILAYAHEGVNNAKKDLETAIASKPKRPRQTNSLSDSDKEMNDSDDDPIEDSDVEIVEVPARERPRPRRAGAAPPMGAYRVLNSPSDDDGEAPPARRKQRDTSEDVVNLLSDNESEEEDEPSEKLPPTEEDDESSPEWGAGTATGGRKLRRRAPPAPRGTRRSTRAGATGAKTYDEDVLMRKYYSSEEEEEEGPKKGARTGRAAAAASDDEAESMSDSEGEDYGAGAAPVRRVRRMEPNNDSKTFDSNAENLEPGPSRRTQLARVARAKPAATAAYDSALGSSSSSSSSEGESSGSEDLFDGSYSDEERRKMRRAKGRRGSSENDEDMLSEDREAEEADEADILAGLERILWSHKATDGSGEVELFVKVAGWSYRRAVWVPRSVIVAGGRQQLVRNFEKKASEGAIDPYGDLIDGVHPNWLEIDRVIASKETSRLGLRHLVKWRGLGYSEATWETSSALEESEADRNAVQRYLKFSAEAAARAEEEEPSAFHINPKAVPDFCNGRSLRPYQLESLEWMAKHWCAGRNAILGDEMGLGKTAQSISVLAFQRQFGGRQGPFLVIAPLTTLGHWQREIETWTDMDCVVYAGSAADRAACQKHDLWIPGSGRGRASRRVKPHVVLSSYETVLRDATLFAAIQWETVIIDEAHRMKTVGSSTRTAIANLSIDWLLLLTGTPVQNNMRELYGLMNLLDPETYWDEGEFLAKFGDERTGMSPEQVRDLQTALKPILLRRMKEDVETLPEKEECIIWTQLTKEQRAYYKAIFEKQIGTLLAGVSQKNAPNLKNLAMELRKVCCHPFLCDGLEEDVVARRRAAGLPNDEVAALVGASGKMLLLHKLLPKLRAEGHKVLIFSQFKIMLDVLEDYMRASQFPCERIDGSTSSRDRQAAIDRYSKEGSEGFVFLLSTRAGGQGITLTAADTCIIYDSDWNPQNDLQAMARCHRIGQEKDVTIYRLVSKDTYEEHVFRTSSRKYGLDEAILGGIAGGGGGDPGSNGGGGDPELDGKKIAELLKHGAHCLDKVDEANAETDAFAAEDIDQILNGRTEKRQIGGRAGNTFSIATFAVEGGASGADGKGDAADDKTFWAALLPDAAAAHAEEKKAAAQGHILLAPRQRKRVNYTEAIRKKRRGSASDSVSDVDPDDSDYDAGEGTDGTTKEGTTTAGSGGTTAGRPAKQAKRKDGSTAGAGPSEPEAKRWSARCVNSFFDYLLKFGFSENGVKKAAEASGVSSKGYQPEDIPVVATALAAMLKAARTAAPGKPPRLGPTNHLMARNRDQIMDELRKAYPAGVPSDLFINVSKDAEARTNAEINASKLAHAQWDVVVSAAGAGLATTTLAAMEISVPAPALKALQDGKLGDKMIRFAEIYHAHLKEVELLATWGDSGNSAPAMVHRSGFPHWWSRADDTRLLKGIVALGWASRKRGDSIQAVLVHPEFGFTERMVESGPMPAQPVAGVNGLTTVNGNEGAQVVAGGLLPGGTGTGMSVNAGAEQDSFQVRPSPNSTNLEAPAAAGGGVVAAPFALAAAFGTTTTTLSAPRAYSPTEWSKLKELLVKHVRSILMYLHAQATAAAKVAAAKAAVEAGVDAQHAQQAEESDFTLGMTRSTSLDSNVSSGSEVTNAPGGGGKAGAASGVGGGLLKQVLRREASKQLGGGATSAGGALPGLSKAAIAAALQERRESGTKPSAGAAAAAAAPAAVPMEQDDDPIELFTDDEDDFKQPTEPTKNTTSAAPADGGSGPLGQTAGGKTAATPGPLAPNNTTTPGSGTVPALNVFKETRGDFTMPQTAAPAAGKAMVSGGGASGSGAVEKAKNMRRSKAGLVGGQRSLLDMPKVQKYLTKTTPSIKEGDGEKQPSK